jgi:hypothetical protein
MIHDRNITSTDVTGGACRYVAAALNLERVRDHMQAHLGCSIKEIAYALDLSADQAKRAVRKIRLEWQVRSRAR